jgi:hypothetical protein
LEEKRDKRPDIDLFLIILLTTDININIYIYRCMHTYIFVLGDFFLITRTNSNGKDIERVYTREKTLIIIISKDNQKKKKNL